jgi:hypothetical protein
VISYLTQIKAIVFHIQHNATSTGAANTLDIDEFELFLAEAANRIFYEESYLPTYILLEKLREVIVEEIQTGTLQELKAFVKQGLPAYRLPWPKGTVVAEGVEKLTLDDFKPKWEPFHPELVVSKVDSAQKLEAFQIAMCLIDELVNDIAKVHIIQPIRHDFKRVVIKKERPIRFEGPTLPLKGNTNLQATPNFPNTGIPFNYSFGPTGHKTGEVEESMLVSQEGGGFGSEGAEVYEPIQYSSMLADEPDQEVAQEVIEWYEDLISKIPPVVAPLQVKPVTGKSRPPNRRIPPTASTSGSHLELLEKIKKDELWKQHDLVLKEKIRKHKEEQQRIVQEQLEAAKQKSETQRAARSVQKAKTQPLLKPIDLKIRQDIERAAKEKREELDKMIKTNRSAEKEMKKAEIFRIKQNSVK